ncbi:hypothetical protein [Streptomyces sp. SID2563]|uniref:hypothetical protein n=1 Tax=Streptomyces sp. SID2563 TaxID=2690255 RepID=UPI001F2BDEF9|nr:hypothetical protein [Streptomyces sp. SID2563]
MSKNTAELVRERAEAPDGPPPVWSGRAVAAGAGALYVGAVLAVEVYGFVGLASEAPAQGDGPGGAALFLPFLTCFGVPSALVASLWLALPTASAARWASARLTGRDAWWWVPVVALVPVSVATAVVGISKHLGAGALAWAWLTGEVLLAGAALIARDAALHGRRLLRVLGYGGLAAVAVLGVGAAAFGTGLVTEYSPPKVNAAGLVGTWSDGRGGTLRLSPDGTARADDLKFHCTGTGTWSYAPDGPTAWDQLVLTEFEDCSPDWRISGTPGHPKLNRDYGEADDPHWYTLTR